MKGFGARWFDYGSRRKLVTREIYMNGNEEQERAIVAAEVEDNYGGSGCVSRIPSSITPSFSPQPTYSLPARFDNQIRIRRIFFNPVKNSLFDRRYFYTLNITRNQRK